MAKTNVVYAADDIIFAQMKVSSNKISDIRRHYMPILNEKFSPDEARFLLDSIIEHYAKIPRLQLAINGDKRVGESLLLKIHFGVKDLLRNKPLQYILGETEFRALRFFVNEHTLIPRPETEELVDQIVNDPAVTSGMLMLDIGTGSCCIAISLAKELNAACTAVDISAEALEVAARNMRENKVDVELLQMDILKAGDASQLSGKFDVIVSNPPYVRNSEKELMSPDVLEFEPAKALFVDDSEPLIFYKAIAELAKSKLQPGGVLFLEINEFLHKEVLELLKAYFHNVKAIKDYKSAWRFVRAQELK